MIQRLILVLGLFSLVLSSACLPLPRQLQKQPESDFSGFKVLGNTFELYYGGDRVGTATYRKDVMWYSDKDYDTQYTLVEDFSYRGTHYRFIFIMTKQLKSIGYLKYNPDLETFRTSESIVITLEKDYVKHALLDSDGRTIKGERQYNEDSIMSQTRDLFAFCNNYLNNYFNLLANVERRTKQENRVQSLGYELLKFDRI